MSSKNGVENTNDISIIAAALVCNKWAQHLRNKSQVVMREQSIQGRCLYSQLEGTSVKVHAI